MAAFVFYVEENGRGDVKKAMYEYKNLPSMDHALQFLAVDHLGYEDYMEEYYQDREDDIEAENINDELMSAKDFIEFWSEDITVVGICVETEEYYENW